MIVRRLPEHLRTKRGRARLKLLRRAANGLAGYYGAPVFLVGSALLDANADPRDWDLRIPYADASFRLRFGHPEQWSQEGRTGNYTEVRWKWSNEMVKQSKDTSARTALNCDVQVYAESYFRHWKNFPRLRLDRRPS